MARFRCIDVPSQTLLSVKIRVESDDHPDLSWLGEYTDNAPDSYDLKRGSAFCRRHRERNTFRFFVPAMSVDEHHKELSRLGYSRGLSEDYARHYCRRDFERMETYGKDWWMLGIWAEANVVINNVIQTVSSGGLFGVESDSKGDYLIEVAREEIVSLKAIMEAMGLVSDDLEDMAEKAVEEFIADPSCHEVS